MPIAPSPLVHFALLFPCPDLPCKPPGIGDATLQALLRKHRELDLYHVQPGGVRGGAVEFQRSPPRSQAPRVCRPTAACSSASCPREDRYRPEPPHTLPACP